MTTNFKDLFTATQGALRTSPDQATATFSVASRQTQGLQSEARVRDFTVKVDEPAALGGDDQAPNPVEYILAALATCQEITFRLYADTLGIPITGVSVKLDGRIDLRGLFGVDDSVRPGFKDIRGSVLIDSPASADDIARLKATVDRHCPVLDILRHATPVRLELALAAPSATPATTAAE